MAFWTERSMEPKRQYRFLLSFGDLDHVHNYMVKSTSKPAWSMEDADHTFLNHTFKYPGRVKWDDISVTLVDPGREDADASRALMNLLERSGYPSNPGDLVDATQTVVTKAAASAAVGDVLIRQLGPDRGSELPEAVIIEQWTLKNAFIKSVKFGDLSYDSEAMVEVTLDLRYDWANVEHPFSTPVA